MSGIIERQIDSTYKAQRNSLQESAVANPNKTPWILSPITISQSTTFDALSFADEGMLILERNVIVTINNMPHYPIKKIFDLSAFGSMVKLLGQRGVHPEWFGAKADWNWMSGTDNTDPFNQAAESAYQVGGYIVLLNGGYLCKGQLINSVPWFCFDRGSVIQSDWWGSIQANDPTLNAKDGAYIIWDKSTLSVHDTYILPRSNNDCTKGKFSNIRFMSLTSILTTSATTSLTIAGPTPSILTCDIVFNAAGTLYAGYEVINQAGQGFILNSDITANSSGILSGTFSASLNGVIKNGPTACATSDILTENPPESFLDNISITAVQIGSTGELSVPVSAGLSINIDMMVKIAYDANNYMLGTVKSYTGTSLVINIYRIVGSGTYSLWTLTITEGGGILFRYGYQSVGTNCFTAAEWASTNPILPVNTLGRESDTLKIKIGNGYTAWNSLPYNNSPSIARSFCFGFTDYYAFNNLWVCNFSEGIHCDQQFGNYSQNIGFRSTRTPLFIGGSGASYVNNFIDCTFEGCGGNNIPFINIDDAFGVLFRGGIMQGTTHIAIGRCLTSLVIDGIYTEGQNVPWAFGGTNFIKISDTKPDPLFFLLKIIHHKGASGTGNIDISTLCNGNFEIEDSYSPDTKIITGSNQYVQGVHKGFITGFAVSGNCNFAKININGMQFPQAQEDNDWGQTMHLGAAADPLAMTLSKWTPWNMARIRLNGPQNTGRLLISATPSESWIWGGNLEMRGANYAEPNAPDVKMPDTYLRACAQGGELHLMVNQTKIVLHGGPLVLSDNSRILKYSENLLDQPQANDNYDNLDDMVTLLLDKCICRHGFDNTALADTMGNYPGTNSGCTFGEGKIGACISSSGGAVCVGVGTITQKDNATQWTLRLCVQSTSLSSVQRVTADDGNVLTILIVSSTLIIYFGGVTATLNSMAQWSSGFNHLVITFNGSGASNDDKAKIYLNKNLQTVTWSGAVLSALPAGGNYKYCGNGSNSSLYGSIDEAAHFAECKDISWINKDYDSIFGSNQSPPIIIRQVGSAGANKIRCFSFPKTAQKNLYYKWKIPDEIDETVMINSFLMFMVGSGWTYGHILWSHDFTIVKAGDIVTAKSTFNFDLSSTDEADQKILIPYSAGVIYPYNPSTHPEGYSIGDTLIGHFYRKINDAQDSAIVSGDAISFNLSYTANKLGKKYF